MRELLLLCWLALLLFIGSAHIALGDPRADLASPSQEVRDAAAKILRETYTPPSREKWDKVVASLQIGMAKADVGKVLSPFHPGWHPGSSGRGSFSEYYLLDDLWVLVCYYESNMHFKEGVGTTSPKLSGKSLAAQMQPVIVAAPADFSGVWTLYYPNGEKFSETHYIHGKRAGEEDGIILRGNCRH